MRKRARSRKRVFRLASPCTRAIFITFHSTTKRDSDGRKIQVFKFLQKPTSKSRHKRNMDPGSRNNFMSKFADANSNALKHLTSQQFFEVWNNYDQDGKYLAQVEPVS